MNAPQKLLTIREVVAATRLSKLTIYKMVRAGKFPQQVRLAEQRVAWLAAEIDGWIADQAAARHVA
jgi:prophage regulatory protein